MVDLPDDAIDVHRSPIATGYTDAHRVDAEGTVSPPAFLDLTLAVEPLLVPPER